MDLLSTTDLLRLPEPTWLIERLFPTRGFVALYGPSGHGKSFVALDLALHIATGRPWQGLSVSQGPVIYIAAEGRGGLSQRVEAWLSCYHVMPPPVFFSFEPMDMLSEGPEDLIKACQGIVHHPEEEPADLYPAMIVVDTLARCYGGDENETADMVKFVSGVDLLRQELQATVLVVHHTGKDLKRGERGSSVLRGATDTMIRIKGQKDEEDHLIGATLSCSKQKDAVEFEPIELRVKPAYKSCIIVPGHTAESALASVRADRSLTSDRARAKAMADLTGLPLETCRHRIRQAT